MFSDSLLSEICENFIADERNIMQALSECLELSHSLPNFTLGNQTKHIMKRNADKGNSVGENNTPKQRKTSSKNGEIATYLSSYYEFRYNTILGRTEYRGKRMLTSQKWGDMKSTRSAGNLTTMWGLSHLPTTSIQLLRAASLHVSIPYRSISRDCHWWM